MDVFETVAKWHYEMGIDPPSEPTLFGYPRELQAEMLYEEVDETLEALADGDMVEFADGIGDAIWILCGMAYRAGIDIRPVIAEIARSNFTKEASIDSGSTKIQKGARYSPPDIATVLRAQGWDRE